MKSVGGPTKECVPYFGQLDGRVLSCELQATLIVTMNKSQVRHSV